MRLEQKGWIKGTWQRTESNREAKYYAITKAGTRALDKQAERWRRLAGSWTSFSSTRRRQVLLSDPPGLRNKTRPASEADAPIHTATDRYLPAEDGG